MCVPVLGADDNKLKRERRLVSEAMDDQPGPNERKIVKVWPLHHPERAREAAMKNDEMWGRSKVACLVDGNDRNQN